MIFFRPHSHIFQLEKMLLFFSFLFAPTYQWPPFSSSTSIVMRASRSLRPHLRMSAGYRRRNQHRTIFCKWRALIATVHPSRSSDCRHWSISGCRRFFFRCASLCIISLCFFSPFLFFSLNQIVFVFILLFSIYIMIAMKEPLSAPDRLHFLLDSRVVVPNKSTVAFKS